MRSCPARRLPAEGADSWRRSPHRASHRVQAARREARPYIRPDSRGAQRRTPPCPVAVVGAGLAAVAADAPVLARAASRSARRALSAVHVLALRRDGRGRARAGSRPAKRRDGVRASSSVLELVRHGGALRSAGARRRCWRAWRHHAADAAPRVTVRGLAREPWRGRPSGAPRARRVVVGARGVPRGQARMDSRPDAFKRCRAGGRRTKIARSTCRAEIG